MAIQFLLAFLAICTAQDVLIASSSSPVITTTSSSEVASSPAESVVLDPTACFDDIVKFCDAQRESGYTAVRTCLESHTAELTAACSTYLQARQAEEQQNCGSEINQYCATAQDPANRDCLKDHLLEVSTVCLEYLRRRSREEPQEIPPRVQRVVPGACDSDVQTVCPNLQGFSAIAQCVSQHWSDLSDTCHTFLRSLHENHREHHEEHHDKPAAGGDDEPRHHRWGHHGDHEDEELMTNCATDIPKLCSDIDKNSVHDVTHCLHHHEDELTNPCYVALANADQSQMRRMAHGGIFVIIAVTVGVCVLCRLRKRCKRRHHRQMMMMHQQQQQPGYPGGAIPVSVERHPAPVATSPSSIMVGGAVPYTGTSYQPVPVHEH